MTKSDTVEMIRGDDATLTVTFTDCTDDEAVIDLTGSTVFFTVKDERANDDDEALISKEVATHSNPTAGITTIQIDPVDTSSLTPGTYLYDLQIKDASSNIRSVRYGKFKIYRDITIRTS